MKSSNSKYLFISIHFMSKMTQITEIAGIFSDFFFFMILVCGGEILPIVHITFIALISVWRSFGTCLVKIVRKNHSVELLPILFFEWNGNLLNIHIDSKLEL